jgi:hypothetical protein
MSETGKALWLPADCGEHIRETGVETGESRKQMYKEKQEDRELKSLIVERKDELHTRHHSIYIPYV